LSHGNAFKSPKWHSRRGQEETQRTREQVKENEKRQSLEPGSQI